MRAWVRIACRIEEPVLYMYRCAETGGGGRDIVRIREQVKERGTSNRHFGAFHTRFCERTAGLTNGQSIFCFVCTNDNPYCASRLLV